MNQEWNVVDFGAMGDGHTDCTRSIQAAIDRAGSDPVGGGVFFPAGEYVTGQLTMRPHVRLLGEDAWSIRNSGGSVLRLNQENAVCLLDITGAFH